MFVPSKNSARELASEPSTGNIYSLNLRNVGVLNHGTAEEQTAKRGSCSDHNHNRVSLKQIFIHQIIYVHSRILTRILGTSLCLQLISPLTDVSLSHAFWNPCLEAILDVQVACCACRLKSAQSLLSMLLLLFFCVLKRTMKVDQNRMRLN